MDESELLRTIRPIWIHRTTLALAKGAGIRKDIRAQLERFFNLLEQAVHTGDPAWLDTILADWAASLTQTDLESSQSSLTQLVSEITLQTNQICRETLDSDMALDLISALMPAFAHAFEKAAAFESEARVNYVSNQLQQAQAILERLDRSKSDFIAVAAHELKTPLTLIEGYAAMLREPHMPLSEAAPPGTAPTLAGQKSKIVPVPDLEIINGIDTGAQRLKAIVEDMIDVSMIDNNLLQLNFQPIWLNRILEMLKDELKQATLERSQCFEVQDFPGGSEMTFADPERLMQVFRNVLSNAIKYTPDGGTISVEGRKLPGFIEVIIHDTGIGIAPEDQGIIFEKFTRLGNASLHSSGKTKFKGGGPGLGLHIAKGIIEAHGGAIWVESPGHDEAHLPGSTFHILLPARSQPPDSKMARLLSPLFDTSTLEEKTK